MQHWKQAFNLHVWLQSPAFIYSRRICIWRLHLYTQHYTTEPTFQWKDNQSICNICAGQKMVIIMVNRKGGIPTHTSSSSSFFRAPSIIPFIAVTWPFTNFSTKRQWAQTLICVFLLYFICVLPPKKPAKTPPLDRLEDHKRIKIIDGTSTPPVDWGWGLGWAGVGWGWEGERTFFFEKGYDFFLKNEKWKMSRLKRKITYIKIKVC